MSDETHLELLTAEDRAWIDDIYGDRTTDPGQLLPEDLARLSKRDRVRYAMRRTEFLQMMPLIKTSIVEKVMDQLDLMADSSIDSDLHQQDVQVLNGDPGVGKTMILKTHVAEEMQRLALLRSIDLEDGVAKQVTVFRPVVYVHLRGPMTQHDLLRLICDELNWPSDRNPQRALVHAKHYFGLRLVVIDEIQHVNFDGKTGRNVHNIIRWMSNIGLRVILSGTAIDWVLQGSNNAAIDVAARNSRGRWVQLDVPKFDIDTEEQRAQWLSVIDAFANRLRLVNAPSDQRWLADEFGDYLWSRTKGYFNSLVLLLNLATTKAMQTGLEQLDVTTFEQCTIEHEVERQRTRRAAKLTSPNNRSRSARA